MNGHKIPNSICIGCGHLADEVSTKVCCPDNKYVTIKEFVDSHHKMAEKWANLFKENTLLKSKLKEAEDAKLLLRELRQTYLVNVDDEGQPKASINEIMTLWDKVNRELQIVTID